MKVLVVTGAGRGIGAAISRKAAERGYIVAAVDIAPPEEAAFPGGGRVVGFKADVTNPDEVSHLFNEVEGKLGKLAGLVNNVGGGGQPTPLVDLTDDSIGVVVAVNLFSTIYCAREAVRRMSETPQGGAIVNVSSTAARLGDNPGLTIYAATKGAVESFTIALAKEVAAFDIRVNAVAPGIVHTEGHDTTAEVSARRIAQTVPMQRAGLPDEVAEAALYLLSPGASYITGETLSVSGGR